MSDVNEHLERLMTRSLDGALTEDEELELNRELIRNPEAHRLMAEYRAVDKLAAAALDRAVAGEAPKFDAATWAQAVPARKRPWHARGWLWLAPGAIAAALLALIVPRPPLTRVGPTPLVRAPSVSIPGGAVRSPFNGARPDMMRSVRSTPAIHRNTGRDIIGVLGDDGNLYWIEVERTRTVTLPAGTSSHAGTGGDL